MVDIISFRALQIANEQRNAYGLRYHDFARYRKHCANRTHRLRSTLKTTHGKGKEFKKLPPLKPETIKAGHLELLLLEAERAWAYAQDLTNQSLQPANATNAGSLRHHATGRFRRSVNWSTQLLSHSQSLYSFGRLSARDLLEVTVYTLVLNGRFLRYREDFDDALIQLSVARSLLDELASAATTSRDQALATLFSDEIGPEIRYCAHELGRTKSYDVDGIVTEVSAKHRNEFVEGCDSILQKVKEDEQASSTLKKKLEPMLWEGQPVPIRNPELVDVLLKVQDAEKKLVGQESATGSKKAVAAYDAILLALSDAEEVGRKLVESHQAGGATPAATGSRDIHFVHAFIVYQLLSRRIQRDLLLISALLPVGGNKPKVTEQQTDARVFPAVVKLLDSVIQSLNQMRTLSIVDDSPDLSTAVEARISFTKARRCLYLSRCYAPLKKYAEALTLLQYASIHIRETRSHLSTTPEELPLYLLTSDTVSELETKANADTLNFKRAWFSYNGGSVDLDPKEYKKPVFFNIAYNYLELDMDRLRERAGRKREEVPAMAAPVPAQQQARKVVVDERPATPEPAKAAAPARGGLGSLLGGWWGKS